MDPSHLQGSSSSQVRDQTGKAPEVYWADDDREDERGNDTSDNAEDSQYTFFREGTPTPPEQNDEHEKGSYAASRSTVGGSLPPAEDSRGCIGRYQQRWGIRRGVLWAIIIAVIVLAIVLPLSVGLGVGLSRSSKLSASTTAPGPSRYGILIVESLQRPYLC